MAFVLIFIMNQITLYTSDDYTYHFFYESYVPNGNTREIKNIFDLINSQKNHYLMWNGRFVGHTLVQIFMQFNKIYFNIINSLAYVALGLIINLIVSKFNHQKISKLCLILTFLFLWFFIPEFGNTVLWVSGSGNYLWTSLICCTFLLYFISNVSEKTKISSFLVGIPFGFIVGATNENSGAATIGICLLFLLDKYFNTKKINLSQLLSIISGFIGSFVLIKSPGASKRSSVMLDVEHIKNATVKLSEMYFTQLKILLLLMIITFVACLFFRTLKKRDLFFIVAFALGSLSSAYSLVLSNKYYLRTLFASTVYIIIPTIYLIRNITKYFENDQTIKVIEKIFLITALGIFLLSYAQNFKPVLKTYRVVKEGITIVSEDKRNGIVDGITIPIPRQTFNSYDSFTNTNSLQPNSSAWFNQWMAKYYEVNSISGKVE